MRDAARLQAHGSPQDTEPQRPTRTKTFGCLSKTSESRQVDQPIIGSMGVINPLTRAVVAAVPGRTSLRTDQSGWTSMLVHKCESPPRMDTPFETLAAPDPVVKLVLSTSNRWIISTAQGWNTYDVTRGSLCFTRPRETHRLRWRQPADRPLQMIHLYIPDRTMRDVAEEMNVVNRSSRARDTVFFDDATVAGLVLAAARAARDGASDAYAQAAAVVIAFHLQAGDASREAARRRHVPVTDERLLRVLEYIEANYSQPLSVDVLASEAGLSRYHFATVFKRALRTSPHQHVREVRLRCARTLLRVTERSVLDIALSCGFASASHFAAAFRADCGVSPTAYRERHRDRSFMPRRHG